MLGANPVRANEEEVFATHVRILGVNGSVTQEDGNGVTITRTGEGAYLATWADDQGQFLGWNIGFGAATPADLAGYTGVRDTYTAGTPTLAFIVYNASDAAADLIANQYADIIFYFKRTGL